MHDVPFEDSWRGDHFEVDVDVLARFGSHIGGERAQSLPVAQTLADRILGDCDRVA